MLLDGSTPDTATLRELRKALGSITSPALLRSQYKGLVESYSKQQSFLYSNSIWAQEDFKIESNFTSEVKEYYDADIKNIDFAKNSSAEEVNTWISKRTKGLIPKLVQGFSPATRLFLANALYFKDKWLVPFQETNETGDSLASQPFFGASKLMVPMMIIFPITKML